MSWNSSLLKLGIACLITAGCASPDATGSGGATKSPSNHSTAKEDSPYEVVLPYAEGYCDNLPKETISVVTPEGMRIEQESVRDKDGTLILHGRTNHYWENDEKKLEVYYRCGLKHGTVRAYFPDGEKWNVGANVNGQGDGLWQEWHTNGFMAQEFTLDHGAWNGVQTSWHQTGKMRLQVSWVNGNRQGIMKIWDEEGTLRRIMEFVDGNIQPSPLAMFSVIDTE